ncbi:hypothetical protein SADUNF_Sadunf13G0111100 [Salix dunnii]|uniref:Uncharacterized protein n=1 Tax=Salix dunnii TaxID=1413687 RepID=A0A835JIE5_9ROSI|nr:hypothetical protein SADUNF_Sadunf13G0111100 [Salix dunnii]
MSQDQPKPTTTLTTTMIKRKEIMGQPSFLFLWITYSYASFWFSLASLFSRLLVSNFSSLSSIDPTVCICQFRIERLQIVLRCNDYELVAYCHSRGEEEAIILSETTTSPFWKFQIQRAFAGVVF